ncbi:MAG: PorV/PorQ family protein, partial [Calditrichaceae bacterium]
MKLKFNRLVSLSIILLCAEFIFAQGEAAVPFLLIDPSVKGQAMAGAMGSVTNDASAVFYNPACLVRTTRFSGEVNHLSWLPQFNFNDLNYYQTAAAFHLPKYGWFGINFSYLNLGSNILTDEVGNELGTFHSYEWFISLGYAYKFSNSKSLGVNFKLFQSNLTDRSVTVGTETGDGNVTSFAFDIGYLQQNILPDYCYHKRYLDKNFTKWTLHRQPPGISLGISISNIGPAITYIDKKQEDPIPQNLRLCVSW